jgi:hypothetical protein
MTINLKRQFAGTNSVTLAGGARTPVPKSHPAPEPKRQTLFTVPARALPPDAGRS